MKASVEMPKINHPTNFHYDRWLHTLQPCEIIKSELDKIINHYIQEYSSTSNPIEVTDNVGEYLFYADENKPPYSVRFKSPDKFEVNAQTDSIDRLVGWFRKRVSIKDYEVGVIIKWRIIHQKEKTLMAMMMILTERCEMDKAIAPYNHNMLCKLCQPTETWICSKFVLPFQLPVK